MRVLGVVVMLVLALGGLLGFRLYRQDAAAHAPAGGAGLVEGTTILVSSRLSARVLEVHVRESQPVAAGDTLVTLDCAEPRAALSEAEGRLEAARAQAEAARSSASASRRSGAATAAAVQAAKAQAAALEAQRDAAKRQADRLAALAADVPASSRDQALAQARALDRQAAGARASGSATGLQAAAAQAQVSAAVAQASAAAGSVKAAQAAVERARLMVAECVVKAPSPGIVETLPYHVGELVGPGAILARLVDLREVRATFYLPNAELAAVRAGAEASIEADAWPGQPFKGTVSTVALAAEFTPRNIQTRSDRDRLVYPIEVSIPNPDGKLRPGMPVQVTLVGTGK